MASKAISGELSKFKTDANNAYRRANREIANKAKKFAISFSSGTISSYQLGKRPPGLNHPYGRYGSNWYGPRGAIPYGNAAIINRQTGIFARSWTIYDNSTFGVPRLTLINIASYASYLEKGTDWMIARPLDQYLRTYIDNISPAIYQRELESAWAKRFRPGK